MVTTMPLKAPDYFMMLTRNHRKQTNEIWGTNQFEIGSLGTWLPTQMHFYNPSSLDESTKNNE